MAGLIKNQILKHLSKFAKNVSADSVNVSTLKGEGELNNLELNETVLTDLLELPTWLRIARAQVNKVNLKIQWTKLKNVPILVTLDEVQVEMETCQELRSQTSSSPLPSYSSGGKYGFTDKVIDGMTVTVNSVLITFSSHAFHATFQLSRIVLDSKNPNWQKADLRMTRLKEPERGELLIFKELTWQTLRVEARSTKDHSLTPLRLITNQARCRITIKKKMHDCSVVACRLVLLMDDLLWVLTDSQLTAAFHFIDSLSDLVRKATQQAQKTKAIRKLENSIQNTRLNSAAQMLSNFLGGNKIFKISSRQPEGAEDGNAADMKAEAKFADEFAQLVNTEQLSPEQVYHADEAALYWHCLPRKPLGQSIKECPSGSRDSEERVTILCCTNASGTHKTKLLVIGESVYQRAFKGVKVLPLIYRCDEKACITTELFLEWFENYFVPEARTHCNSVGLDPKCKIFLILGNCSVYPKAELLTKDNVSVLYLPPNCTSVIQPCGMGTVHLLKSKYRSEFLQCFLIALNNGKLPAAFLKEFNLKDMVWLLAFAWNSIEKSTLRSGWLKLWPSLMFQSEESDECRASSEEKVIHDEITKEITEESLEEWMNIDNEVPVVYQPPGQEIMEMVQQGDTREGHQDDSAEKNEDVEERISVDECIQMTRDLIAGLEQRDFITAQEIMSVYLIQRKLISKQENFQKQATLEQWLKDIPTTATIPSTVENPFPSISSTQSVHTAMCHEDPKDTSDVWPSLRYRYLYERYDRYYF